MAFKKRRYKKVRRKPYMDWLLDKLVRAKSTSSRKLYKAKIKMVSKRKPMKKKRWGRRH
jgi:hypothetical protein